MPRRARVLWPGVTLHLIQWRNSRSACFFAEEDYLFYLEQLRIKPVAKSGGVLCFRKKGTDLFFGIGQENSLFAF